MMEMTITLGKNRQVDAQVGKFTINTDQPVDEGGDGTALEPFALFLVSIGTCAGVYVSGFCRSRDLPSEGITITQTNDWNKEQKRVVKVELTIHLPPEFPEKYRQAVVRAAEQCTVKRNIMTPPEFVVESVVG